MNRRGDLIARVMEIDKEAGMLIASDKFLTRISSPALLNSSKLNTLFLWKKSPQGVNFWKNISKQLGEW
jgi:hypothetical protein